MPGSTAARSSVDSVALRLQASAAPSRKKVATSRGSPNCSGPGWYRRINQAPNAACAVAPSALISGMAKASPLAASLGALTEAFITTEPSRTAGSTRQP